MKSCFQNLNAKFECFFMFKFHNEQICFFVLIKSTFSHTVYLSRALSSLMIVFVYLPTFKLCKEKIYFYRDAYTSYCSLLKLASLQIVQPLLSYSWLGYLLMAILEAQVERRSQASQTEKSWQMDRKPIKPKL